MKKTLFVMLIASLLCFATACTSQTSGTQSAVSVSNETESVKSEPVSAAESQTVSETSDEASELTAQADSENQKLIDETIEDYEFEGVIYAEKGGAPFVSFASGTLENGDSITVDTPMPIGSVSKQFCAAAVLLLQEQNKLSIDDTLDKYFPDYAEGKNISLKNLLSMRSGIPEVTSNDDVVVSIDKTEKENTDSIKEWIFKQPLQFEPDSRFEYVNANYFLLADVVEQVSGEKYIDFLRSSFFEPLGMKHTGSIGELDSSPEWANGVDFQQVDRQPGLTNGCGDLISTTADMTTWINALAEGKSISKDSYKAMTTSYSDEQYGYGMYTSIKGGVGHYGAIGIYSAFDYINEDNDFVMIVFSNSIYPLEMTGLSNDLIIDLMT